MRLYSALALSIVDAPPDCALVNRELSWLHFNARVLQEAENPSVPLYERLNYLAIFSSNLDEFFSVRVAALRSLLRLSNPGKGLDEDPADVLRAIHQTVHALQERFGSVLRESILPALGAVGRPLARYDDLSPALQTQLRRTFEREIRPRLKPVVLGGDAPSLEHQQIYLACELWPEATAPDESTVGLEPACGLVPVPGSGADRFVVVHADASTYVLFVEDAVRPFLGDLFPGYRPDTGYSFKVSRDAELYLGDCPEEALTEEFGQRFRKRLRKSLDKRGTGAPTRFLYDPEMPARLLGILQARHDLASEDLMPGGRYHHLRDLRAYPQPEETGTPLCFPPHPPQPHPVLAGAASLFASVAGQDQMLMLPYQQFDPVVRWVEEAAQDPDVTRIAVTIYRTAENSALTRALAAAARNGKQVEAVVELKARFDESNNLDVSDELTSAGVRVCYTPCHLKVHAKLILFERREDRRAGDVRRYAYLGTGNLNEVTARLYTDFGLLTADARLTDDVARVFEEMAERAVPEYESLLVAPRSLRTGLYALIDAEAERARRGEDAWLLFKMNALEDPKMIRHLCKAVAAGVRMRLLVRGICRFAPDAPPGQVEIRSIVGRYLEHGRAYVFGNGDEPLVYLGSADLMRRNLSRRIEVLFPVLDATLAREVLAYLDIQWQDTLKARIIDRSGANLFVHPAPGAQPVSSQDLLYARYGGQMEPAPAASVPARPVAAPRAPKPSRMTTEAQARSRRPSITDRILGWIEANPARSSVVIAALLLVVPVSILVARSLRGPADAQPAAGAAPSGASYVLERPDTVLTLHSSLAEISGHEWLNDSLIAAVEDEHGILYFLDPQTGAIVHRHNFAPDGDYEEVTSTPDGLFVVSSDATLYHVPDWSAPVSDATVYETPLRSRCDAEGMAFDEPGNRLLIVCKEDPGKGMKEGAFFAFDLATRTMTDSVLYQIDLDAVAAALRDAEQNPATAVLAEALDLNEFKPSGLAIHPHNGQMYVVSSVPPSIAVLSPEGRVLGAALLPESIFPQPEGITFRPDGDMYVSTEAAESGASRLARFRYLKR